MARSGLGLNLTADRTRSRTAAQPPAAGQSCCDYDFLCGQLRKQQAGAGHRHSWSQALGRDLAGCYATPFLRSAPSHSADFSNLDNVPGARSFAALLSAVRISTRTSPPPGGRHRPGSGDYQGPRATGSPTSTVPSRCSGLDSPLTVYPGCAGVGAVIIPAASCCRAGRRGVVSPQPGPGSHRIQHYCPRRAGTWVHPVTGHRRENGVLRNRDTAPL